MTKIRTYGYDRVKMAENLSIEQLVALQESLTSDPANRTNARYWGGTEDTIWLYNKKTRTKLDNISWAIYLKQTDADRKKRIAE